MTPFPPSQFRFIPLVEGDQDQSHLLEIPPCSIPTDTSSVPYPILFNNPQIQGANDRDHHLQQQVQLQQQQQLEHKEHLMIQRSSDHLVSFPINGNNNNTVERSLCNQYIREDQDQHRSGKWMSSKMRFMRKMMNPDGIIMRKPRRNKRFLQDQQPPPPRTQESSSSNTSNHNSTNGGIIRVCSDCNTTKTPLWRSGPSGPKSLCNACGIRQRKARRAMAAAAVSGGLFPAVTPRKIQKEKRADADRTLPFKKRCRIAAARTAQKKICFDDIVISLSKSSAFHRVFPQDEKDAAILLMALSCGLICS